MYVVSRGHGVGKHIAPCLSIYQSWLLAVGQYIADFVLDCGVCGEEFHGRTAFVATDNRQMWAVAAAVNLQRIQSGTAPTSGQPQEAHGLKIFGHKQWRA
jgi:hypothetical protein